MTWTALILAALAIGVVIRRARAADAAALDRVVEAGGTPDGDAVVVRRSEVDVRLRIVPAAEGALLDACADWPIPGGPTFMLRPRVAADVVYAVTRELPPSLERIYRLESEHDVSVGVVMRAESSLVARHVSVHAFETALHVTVPARGSASDDALLLDALAEIAARIASAPLDVLRPRAETIGGVIERGAILLERASGNVRLDASSTLELLQDRASWVVSIDRPGPAFEHRVEEDGEVHPAPARGTVAPALLAILPPGARIASDGQLLYVDLPDVLTDELLRAIADALAAAPSSGTFR